MVNKRRYQDQGELPPPMEESWWEAVLAEDEAQLVAPSKNTRAGFTNGPFVRPETAQVSGTSPTATHPAEPEPNCLDWHIAFQLYEQDQVVTLTVTGCNRGGLLVSGEKLQGFVPVSHLIEAPCEEVDLEKWLGRYLDRELNLKVIECDQERGRVVFSERAAQSSPGSRKLLLKNLQPGDCATGMVTNITEFGVFVDLGGVEGLVHVSEISWGRVHHPAEVVSLGQQVKVYVIQVNQERARVALSLKRLYPNPWETAESRYIPGQITEAVVTSVVQFGAFARLEEGLDGLIHISELGPGCQSASPESLLQEGQRVQVRVLHVDAARQRLGLSLNLTPEAVPGGEVLG
jgi:small subunit ribosomal protein S1